MNAQEKIQQVQLIEQNIQQLLVQKQAVQSQLIEVQSALEEITDGGEAFKVIGNIMVKTKPDVLRAELTEKKERHEVRIQAVEKQEERLREKAQSLQKDIMESMNESDRADAS